MRCRGPVAGVYESGPRGSSEFCTCLDRFHIMQMLHRTITDCRRTIYRKLPDETARRAIKGNRFVLLKRRSGLDPACSGTYRILGAANEPRFRVLARKRDQEIPTSHVQELIVSSERPTSRGFVSWRGSAIKNFWNQPDRAAAEGHLLDWLSNAEALKISALTAFCRTLRPRLDGLLSWYAYPISTGPLEGMNNKIKTLKRRSYGFRAPTYFRLKILNIHQIRYALVG